MMGQSFLSQVLNDQSAHLQYEWIIATLLGQRRTPGCDPERCPDKSFGQSESEFLEVIKRLTQEARSSTEGV
jgi:hypothetical protein